MQATTNTSTMGAGANTSTMGRAAALTYLMPDTLTDDEREEVADALAQTHARALERVRQLRELHASRPAWATDTDTHGVNTSAPWATHRLRVGQVGGLDPEQLSPVSLGVSVVQHTTDRSEHVPAGRPIVEVLAASNAAVMLTPEQALELAATLLEAVEVMDARA